MAHDWLGTFNKSQLERFLVFARSQLPLIADRISHLEAEQNRIGTIVFTYEQGVPTEYKAGSADSYIGRLLAAYEVLGGNPVYDLRTRLKTEPVFLLRGSVLAPAYFMSNGEVVGARGKADGPSAEIAHQLRGWLTPTFRYRFERLERKIRRALDYVDSLQQEVDYLTRISLAVSSTGSLEQLAAQLQQLIEDPNYRAIYDDQGKDPFGLFTHAPFSSYDAVKSNNQDVNRVADSPQRQSDGYVGSGEQA